MTATKFIDTAEVAKIVRTELKQAFGKTTDTKFSVRSRRYAGGSSIDVQWTDGPAQREVEKVISYFKGSTFDGMTDCRHHHDSEWDGKVVQFGNDYIFAHRTVSNEVRNRVKDIFCELFPQCLEEGYFSEYNNGAPYWVANHSKHTSGVDWDRSFNRAIHLYDACTNQFIVKDLWDSSYYDMDNWQHIGQGEPAKGETTDTESDQQTEQQADQQAPQVETIDPEPVAICPVIGKPKRDIFVTARFARLNKRNMLAEYQTEVDSGKYHEQRCKVAEIAYLTPQEWDSFQERLLEDFTWLAGKGGSESDADLPEVEHFWEWTPEQQDLFRKTAYSLVIAVVAKGRLTLYIDPQGYNYARYVGI